VLVHKHLTEARGVNRAADRVYGCQGEALPPSIWACALVFVAKAHVVTVLVQSIQPALQFP